MNKYQIASPKYRPLFTLIDPSTGKRPTYIVLSSARGTGKSVTAFLALLQHVSTKKMRAVVARQFATSIDESAAAEIKSCAEIMGIAHEFEWLNNKITHYHTGSTITFRGLERNKGSIKGLAQIDLLIVEEAQDVAQESLDYLLPTIRKPKAMVWFLINPRRKTDPVAATFLINDYPKTLVIVTTYKDNRFWTEKLQDDMDAMRANDPVRARNIWDGEFIGAEDNTLILPHWVDEARTRFPIWSGTEPKIAGCDVSRLGVDETVFVLRQGAKILAHETLKGGDTHAVAFWLEQQFMIHHPECMVVDATGSAGQYDVLKKAIGHIIPVTDYVGSRAADDITFYNSRMECWDRMATWVRTAGSIDKESFPLLSEPTYSFVNDRKLLEKKEQIKKRLGRSPDHEDALSLTFLPYAEKLVAAHRRKLREAAEAVEDPYGSYSNGFAG